jgi:hypothetical protein
MIDTPEKLAIHILGQERYDNSPAERLIRAALQEGE